MEPEDEGGDRRTGSEDRLCQRRFEVLLLHRINMPWCRLPVTENFGFGSAMCRHGRAKIPVLLAIRDTLQFRHNTLRTIPAMLQRDEADLADW
jgi:hypothetical protein